MKFNELDIVALPLLTCSPLYLLRCEFHGANARLEQTGAKKLNAYGFRKSHGRFDRAYDHQIGFEDGEQSGDRTPETGDRWPDEGGEQGASEVAGELHMPMNVHLECLSKSSLCRFSFRHLFALIF